MTREPKAVVLTSGGLDSATVLAIAKHRGYRCYCLSIDYGQRHIAELKACRRLTETIGVEEHKIIEVNLKAIGGSALTDSHLEIPIAQPQSMAPEDLQYTEIPVTYVPARNTVFLSIALGYAEVVEANTLFLGINAVDYSGYPDCRPEYISAFAKMAALATRSGVQGQAISIETPLIEDSKADIIRKGTELGLNYSLTVSCYQADNQGNACGACDSCYLRRRGFEEAGIADPTRYFSTPTSELT